MRILFVLGGVCPSQGEDEPALRQCYEGVERDGEVIHVRDTVLLRSGPRKKSLPYVAKISAFWEDPKTGDTEEERELMNKYTVYICTVYEMMEERAKIVYPYVCVCTVCVPICLLRRADDESFLVLPARAHPGRQRSQHTQ